MFQLAKKKQTSNQFDDNVFIHIIIQNHNVMIFQFICLCFFLYILEHFNQYLQRNFAPECAYSMNCNSNYNIKQITIENPRILIANCIYIEDDGDENDATLYG